MAQKSSVEDTAPGLVDKLIAQFTLNTEQAHAFRLVAEHAMGNQEQLPLHMFIGGAGGTGKSRVIEALSYFFQIRNETRRFRLSSYTGIAARNISGMTLHTALNLGQLKTMIEKNESRSRKELIESWEGVDYLFIDEVSMVGCSMLVDISMALGIAKESTAPFGGINVIFAGDFCQLPPVGDTPLYTAIESVTNKPSDSQTENGQKKIKGLTLWHGISVVILLSKSMRQSGQENERFRALLERLRFGICTDDDVRLLKSRLLSKAEVNLNQSCWRSAPIITRSNVVKDALNLRGIQCMADELHTTVNFYEAEDRHAGKKISRGPLRDYLLGLHSGRTKHTMGRLPLLPGMPVIIGHNYDVHGGIVNGSEGILKSVRYRIDEEGRRRATSCIVTVASASDDPLPHLPSCDVVVLEEDIRFTVPHPETGAQWSFVRKQLPILPAFSFTDYKAQGKTLPNIIIDLQSCTRLSSAYVMVSRATSLSGLLILRPFDANKVRAHASQDFRCDARRLLIHSLKTILSSPSEYSRHDEATAQLAQSKHTMHSPQTRSMTPIPRGVDADMQPNGSSGSLSPYINVFLRLTLFEV